MKKLKGILLFIAFVAIALMIGPAKSDAATYIWPVGGDNADETYKDYDFYGDAYSEPYKDGKSGREYIVNNELWPDEQYYYAYRESHFGMDITGINGHTYSVVSVSDGTVIATSGTRISNPSINYADRNQRMVSRDGGGYGNYVIIREDSTGKCFFYAHLRAGTIKVNKGDTVKAGQEIATMGSSGDAGHMHLHFEVRKNQASTIGESSYGAHYLVDTTWYTNLDPEDYIGSEPGSYVSKDDMKYYVKYLYKSVLKREAKDEEAEAWANRYMDSGSIFVVTKGIVFSVESMNKNGVLSNSDFVKWTYNVILHRNNNYTEKEMATHIAKLDNNIWTKEQYLEMLCNCPEFLDVRLRQIIDSEKPTQTEPNPTPKEDIGIAKEEELTKLGDIDGDGRISACDASLCLRFASLSDKTGYEYAIKYADSDNDGKVTTDDALHMLSYYAQLSVGNDNQTFAEYMGRPDIN